MKKSLLVTLLCLIVIAGCTGPEDGSEPSESVEDFSIDGTWTVENQERNEVGDGYDSGTVTMNVLETEGQTFSAEVMWGDPEGEAGARFVGSISPGGDMIAGASEDGIYSFSIVDENTLDYCYSETGEDYLASCGRFTRDE